MKIKHSQTRVLHLSCDHALRKHKWSIPETQTVQMNISYIFESDNHKKILILGSKCTIQLQILHWYFYFFITYINKVLHRNGFASRFTSMQFILFISYMHIQQNFKTKLGSKELPWAFQHHLYDSGWKTYNPMLFLKCSGPEIGFVIFSQDVESVRKILEEINNNK